MWNKITQDSIYLGFKMTNGRLILFFLTADILESRVAMTDIIVFILIHIKEMFNNLKIDKNCVK